jgi:hypothetical protein
VWWLRGSRGALVQPGEIIRPRIEDKEEQQNHERLFDINSFFPMLLASTDPAGPLSISSAPDHKELPCLPCHLPRPSALFFICPQNER